MAKQILILSSDITGHGHKSITEALTEQFARIPNVRTHIVDGFSLGNEFGLQIGRLYGTVTRNARLIWKLIWSLSVHQPALINRLVEMAVRRRLIELIQDLKPDLILSVHPNFNTPVLNILQACRLEIPFVILIADLVSISPLWTDLRARWTICPTIEAKRRCLAYGIPEYRLKTMGFPVRARFYKHATATPTAPRLQRGQWTGLIISGAEGSGSMEAIAKTLLQHFACSLKIVTGRNARLKQALERRLPHQFPSRVEIHGFTDQIHELMHASDIAFVRGSPNVVMEAVAAALPVVVSGFLPGQEEGNPDFILRHNLGRACRHPAELKPLVNHLLTDEGRRLAAVRSSQVAFIKMNPSENIGNFICSQL